MVFLTLICPGCQKSTVIDDDDEDSYCMHCGTRFDRQAVESASELDPVIGAALQMSGALGEPYELADYSGEPWYQGLDGIESMLSEGDSEAAAEAVAKLLDENPESAEDIETCVRDRITGWVVDCIVDGEPYIGGIADIARVVEEYGEDSGPNILVASMFYALTQTPEIMRVPEDAGVMAESLFNLLMEYPQVEPDIREQLEMCTDFMHVSGLMIDAADAMGGDDQVIEDVRQWIYRLQDFVRLFGDAIYDAAEVGDERLDRLTEVWTENDISTIGCNVSDIADRYLDEEIDDDGARSEVKAVLDDYLSIVE